MYTAQRPQTNLYYISENAAVSCIMQPQAGLYYHLINKKMWLYTTPCSTRLELFFNLKTSKRRRIIPNSPLSRNLQYRA